MADAFISYKREDRSIAAQAAAALNRAGVSVFFDFNIPVGDQFDEFIEAELAAAKVVVVLWSPRSVESRWVKNEARHGLAMGRLCPVIVEDCDIPLECRDLQAAKISDFTSPSAELDKLLDRVCEHCDTMPPPSASQPALFRDTGAERPTDYDHFLSSIRHAIEACDFISFLSVQDDTSQNIAEIHKAFSRLKIGMGDLISMRYRTFEKSGLFVGIDDAKFLIWEAEKRTLRWPIFNEVRKAWLKREIDEAAFSLSGVYGALRNDVVSPGDHADREPEGRNPHWFNGSRLSAEGIDEIQRQFEAGKTVYAAAKHMGISYRAASLRHEAWKSKSGA